MIEHIREWWHRDSARTYVAAFALLNTGSAISAFLPDWRFLGMGLAMLAGMAMAEARELRNDEGYCPPQPRPRLVIAGNYGQFREFMRAHGGEEKELYKYAGEVSDLVGWYDPEVFLWGTFWEKPDMLGYCRSMGWIR